MRPKYIVSDAEQIDHRKSSRPKLLRRNLEFKTEGTRYTYAYIVLGSLVIELSKTPINQSQLRELACEPLFRSDKTHLSVLVIDHNIVGLDISVHKTLAMTKVQSLSPVSLIRLPDRTPPTFNSSKM